MKKVSYALFLFFAVVASACERTETFEVDYPNYTAALESGSVGADRWIPELLPQSAVDIRERHDMDTNEIWLYFRFASEDISLFSQSCKQISTTEVSYPREKPSKSITWWPRRLLMKSGGKRDKDIFVFYHCKDNGTLAIDLTKTEAFYWHLGD